MDFLISGIGRLLFAAFLFVAGGIGMFMAGMSGDAGPNPLFYYLSVSVLIFLVAGVAILFSPASFLASPRSKWLWWTFGISMLHPMVGFMLAVGLSGHKTAVHDSDFARICVTQHSSNPQDLAWVGWKFESDTHFTGADRKEAMSVGETECEDFKLANARVIQYVAAPWPSAGGQNRFASWSLPAGASPVHAFAISPTSTICLGIQPTLPQKGTQATWLITTEQPCSR